MSVEHHGQIKQSTAKELKDIDYILKSVKIFLGAASEPNLS